MSAVATQGSGAGLGLYVESYSLTYSYDRVTWYNYNKNGKPVVSCSPPPLSPLSADLSLREVSRFTDLAHRRRIKVRGVSSLSR